MFISHSTRDSTIVSAVKQAFEDLPLKPHFVEDKPSGMPPSKEIAQAVKDAQALFVFLTTNSLYGETRDWIVFEIGVAVGYGMLVYSWKQRSLTKEQLPRLLEQVSTYREFDISGDGTIRLTKEIRDAAKRLRIIGPTVQDFQTQTMTPTLGDVISDLGWQILEAAKSSSGTVTATMQIARTIGQDNALVYEECVILRDSGFLVFTDDTHGMALLKITGLGLRALRDRRKYENR